jgi:hypothetical protein
MEGLPPIRALLVKMRGDMGLRKIPLSFLIFLIAPNWPEEEV